MLEAYTPRQLALGTGGPKDLDMLVSLETVKSKLAGLDWQIDQELDRKIPEGTHHSGMGAVVQILGKAH